MAKRSFPIEEISSSSGYPIWVRIPFGNVRNISINVKLCTSVAQLKAMISRATGLPESEQRIIYCGKQLHQSDSLMADHNILKDSTLHLVMGGLRGGCWAACPSCGKYYFADNCSCNYFWFSRSVGCCSDDVMMAALRKPKLN